MSTSGVFLTGQLTLSFPPEDVDTLRNGLRRFAEAFTREERPRAVGATFGSTNHVVEVEILSAETDQRWWQMPHPCPARVLGRV